MQNYLVNWTWFKSNGSFKTTNPWEIVEPNETDDDYQNFTKKDIIMIVQANDDREIKNFISKIHKRKNIKPTINWTYHIKDPEISFDILIKKQKWMSL